MRCRFLMVGCTLLALGCSPSTGNGGNDSPFANGSGGQTSGGGAGSTPPPGAGGDIFGPVGTAQPPNPNAPDGSCGAVRMRGEQVTVPIEVTITENVPQPVALYFMLDQSGSMLENDKWGAAVRALTAFTADPRSAGITVGLQMFSVSFLPPSGCGICDGSDCRNPMVAMAPLPGAASAIATALNRIPIGIGTPIEAGLRGGVDFCTQRQQQTPGEKCVVVFISDGAPSACAGDGASLGAIARTAKDQHGVLTFTIGMAGADFLLMDAIAQGAGTDCTPGAAGETCNASTNTDFLAALESIRTSVVVTRTETRTEVQNKPVDCEFQRPEPQAGDVFDKTKVNVQFTTGGQTFKVGKANNVSECPPEGGWYYDNEDAPTKILVCPATCTTIQGAADVDVSVLLGCDSEPIIR